MLQEFYKSGIQKEILEVVGHPGLESTVKNKASNKKIDTIKNRIGMKDKKIISLLPVILEA